MHTKEFLRNRRRDFKFLTEWEKAIVFVEILFLISISTIVFGLIFDGCNNKAYASQLNNNRIEATPTAHIREIEIIEVYEEPVPEEPVPDVQEPRFTQEDISLLMRVCMSEASTISLDAKQAIVTTVLNRLDSGKWGTTLEEVVNYPNAYSTRDNGVPTQDCYDAVMAAIQYQDAYPNTMYYFREDHYHTFGTPYCHIGTTYFSLEK